MINLVKNELIKIFHKKVFYIMLIITFVITAFGYGVEKYAYSYENDGRTKEVVESEIASLNKDDYYSVEYYVENLSDLQKELLLMDYDENSFEYYYINNNILSYINCMNTAKIIDNNTDEYNTCKDGYDQVLVDAKTDWKEVINGYINDSKEQIENDKLLLESCLPSEKVSLENDIKLQEEYIKIYQKRLDDNISINNSDKSKFLNTYLSKAESYYNGLSNTSLSVRDLNNLKSQYEVYKYKYENNDFTLALDDIYGEDDSVAETNLVYFFQTGFIMETIIVIIMILFGTVVANEFEKGTIKNLLVKPYSRIEILVSKYIACFITLLLYTILATIGCSIIIGIIYGFGSYSNDIIMYNLSSNKIVILNLIEYLGYLFIMKLPEYLILSLVVFAISVVSTSSAISMIMGFVLSIGGSIINIFVPEKYLKYLPTATWDLTDYMFGNISSYKYNTFKLSLIVDIICMLVLIIIPIIVFKNKDIKNQ